MKDAHARFTAGAVAGIIAGSLMAGVAMIRAAYAGMSFWFPAQLVAAAFYGVDALLGGAGIVVVGLAIHAIFSAFFGGVVGVFAAKLSSAGAFGIGISAGMAIWGVMAFLVLPATNEVMRERVALMREWWFAYHLIFGGMLFLTPVLNRALAQGRSGAHPPRDVSH